MGRGLAYNREQRNKHIARKKRLSNELYGCDWYKVDGMYDKGKIHCSCKMCTYEKYYDFPRLKDEIDKERIKSEFSDLSDFCDNFNFFL